MKILEDFFDFQDFDKSIWRYMSLEKLDLMLESKSLYFASAEQFNENDDHEGAITEKEYKKRIETIKKYSKSEDEIKYSLKSLEKAYKVLRQYAKISCWHLNEYENMAMWNYYQGKEKGIAIETTPRKLIDFVEPYRIKENYGEESIHLGRIKYIDYVNESMDTRYGFLTPYLYKRKAYSYENEMRMIISLRLASEYGVEIPKKGILVPFDIANSISRIVLSPQVDEVTENKIKAILEKHKFSIPIGYSELMKKPKF